MSALDRHRGPFQFQVTRLAPTTPCGVTVALLDGETSRDDVMARARTLLTDPRDTIVSVSVWSCTEQQHIGTITADNFDTDL
jgi:hypothetical protein